MDAKHFEAGTRRKFGLTAGNALAALVAWRGADDASAGRRVLTVTIPRFGRAFLALLLAAQAAGLLAEVGPEPAEAAFPGANGMIAFASTRTSGNGVDNPGGDYELFVMKPDGSGLFQLTINTTQEDQPAWSADGQWLAYNGGSEIYIRRDRISFPVTRRLTTNAANDSNPAWSPDGTKIAFTSDRDGDAEIYVMDTVDNNNDNNADVQTNLTTTISANDLDPAWSPDGTRIAFYSNRNGNYEIYVMNTNGSDPINLTNNAAVDSDPNWSPDGSKIVFMRSQNNNADIYVMNADGSGQKRLTKNGAHDVNPAWSPDGTKIVFMSDRGGDGWEIYIMKAKPESKKNRPKARTKNDEFDGNPDWRPIP